MIQNLRIGIEISLVLIKNALILQKKSPARVCLWFKFPFKSAVLRVPWRKNTGIFPCVAVLFYVLQVAFIEVPILQETTSTLKNPWLRAFLHEYEASSVFSRSIIHICFMRKCIIQFIETNTRRGSVYEIY